MRYRTLGRTGIKVSPYALGAMMFGSVGNPDHEGSIAIIHKALDAGINFIDTAKRDRDAAGCLPLPHTGGDGRRRRAAGMLPGP